MRIFLIYKFLAGLQELEAERTQLMEDVMENKRKMQELEANLLHKLTTTEVHAVLVNGHVSHLLPHAAGACLF